MPLRAKYSRSLLPLACGVAATLSACSGPPTIETGTAQAKVEGGEVDENTTQVFRVLARVTGFNELCTATLIAPQLMLTARHCVAPTPSSNVNCETDRFGPTVAPTELKFSNATQPDLTSRWFSAAAVLVSPESDLTCGYDIAVVVLTEPVPQDIAVPAPPRFAPTIERGETYVAVGYGASNANEEIAEFGIRHSRGGLSVTCGQNANCDLRAVKAQEFVGDEGACRGDSGGPAFDLDGQVIGVLSRGAEGCESPVYVGVPAFESLLVDAAQFARESVGAPLPVWAGGVEAPPSDETVDVESPTTEPTRDVENPSAPDAGAPAIRSGFAAEGCSVSTPGTQRSRGAAWALLAVLLFCLKRRKRAADSGISYTGVN